MDTSALAAALRRLDGSHPLQNALRRAILLLEDLQAVDRFTLEGTWPAGKPSLTPAQTELERALRELVREVISCLD